MLSKVVSSLAILVLVLQACSGNTLDSRCPRENGPMPIRFVHPTDCNKFYTCDWGMAIVQECPVGMHFGWIGVCMLPELARCVDAQASVPQLAPAPESPPQGVAAAQPRSSYDHVDPEHIQADPRCPKDNPVHPHAFRHSKNCARYYICNWGLAIPMFCPPELAFNEDTKNCDFISKVKGC